jgi:hypothetical protein
MRPMAGRWRTATAAIAVLLAACGTTPGYFNPPPFRVALPLVVGRPVYVGVAFLQDRQGSSVTLERAELIGAVPEAAWFALEAVDLRPGEEGIGTATDPQDDNARQVAALAPIDGYQVTGTDPGHSTMLVLTVKARVPADLVAIDGFDLVYRINGGPARTERFDVKVRMCSNAPATDC